MSVLHIAVHFVCQPAQPHSEWSQNAIYTIFSLVPIQLTWLAHQELASPVATGRFTSLRPPRELVPPPFIGFNADAFVEMLITTTS